MFDARHKLRVDGSSTPHVSPSHLDRRGRITRRELPVGCRAVTDGCSTSPRAYAGAPVAAVPTTAAPSLPSAPAGAPASDWQAIVAAANKEGHIVVIGPTNSDIATVLVDGFQTLYPQISVDFTSLAWGAVGPKVLTELSAGQHLTDLVLSAGMSTLLSLRDQNALTPLQPYLSGPEGQSSSNWTGGTFTFADEAQQYALALSYIAAPTLAYNPTAVPPGTVTSFKDLLNPTWKSKLAMYDPRVAGTGQAAITMMYTSSSLGPDYLRQLFAQDVSLSRDDRQLVDFVVQGVYPIEATGSQTVVAPLQRSGISVSMLGGPDMQEGSWISATGASVVSQPPHPNAAQVYLDYVLSQAGQTAYCKALG